MVNRAAPKPRAAERRSYKKPPLVEAVCEFQFRGAKEWDWTIPGLLYKEIQSEFPQKRQEKSFEVTIAQKEGKIEQMGGGLSKMQFVRSDGSAMVQVGPDLLAINVLPPYPNWEGFKELISRHFWIYAKIAEPIGFKRIGLRYINKITFPTAAIETTDYFELYPKLPGTVRQEHGPFTMHILHVYEAGRDVLNIRMGHTKSNGENLSIVLDLDYYSFQLDKVELEKGMEWVSLAHDNLEAMFEACITDKTRALLEEG